MQVLTNLNLERRYLYICHRHGGRVQLIFVGYSAVS